LDDFSQHYPRVTVWPGTLFINRLNYRIAIGVVSVYYDFSGFEIPIWGNFDRTVLLRIDFFAEDNDIGNKESIG